MASKKNQKHPKTNMEELTKSLIHPACELARNLESELPNLTNQPRELSMAIDEIVKAFSAAKEKLFPQESQQTVSSAYPHHQMLPHEAFKLEAQPPQNMGATDSMQDQWLSSTMDRLYHMQQLQAAARSTATTSFDIRGLLETRIEGEAQEMEASHLRPRRRKNDPEKKILLVPAPQYGNTDMPPEDGYTWRKYGQKEILGSKYPRSYYRCTHQKLYECLAKKQLQRLDQDPNIFAVTYRGEHTCHKSSTAPSAPPQLLVHISPDMMTQGSISQQFSPSLTSVSGWMPSTHLSLQGGSVMAPVAGAEASTSASAGPSASRYGTNTDQYQLQVAEMADVMFNSGSSSGNSMESVFPPTEEKWEPGEKKS